MSQITGVSISFERKVGLPNYSSLTFWASATAQVDDGDDPEEVLHKTAKMLNRVLSEEQQEVGAAKPGVTVVEMILGRPVM